MFLNHLFTKAIGVSMMFLFFHSFAAAQAVLDMPGLQSATMPGLELEGWHGVDDDKFSSTAGQDQDLCALLINQAELSAQNHLNSRGRSELVVVDNAVARAMICPTVFDRPIKLMRLEDIRRAKISAYLEFEEVSQQEPHLATARYKLICTEGCNSWQYDLRLKIYEGTSNWAIIQNASAPIGVEPTK